MTARLALAAVAGLIAFVVAEGALWLLGIGDVRPGSSWFAGGNHPRFLFEPDEQAGYRLRPGFSGREVAATGEFDVPVSIDELGLRDHRHGAAARPAILALGDSLTFGEGVAVDQAYPAILEAHVGSRVYNAGVPGYSSRQMTERMRELLPMLGPSLVILTLSPLWDASRLENPFVYRHGYIVSSDYAHRLHLIRGNLFASSLDVPLLGPLTAYAKATSRLARLALPRLGRIGPRREEPAAWEASVLPTADELRRAAVLANSRGAAFLTVLVDSRSDAHRRARRQLEEQLTAALLAPVVLDRLLGEAEWETLRFPRDGHWNAAAHRRVASVLDPFVETCLRTPAECAGRRAGVGPAAGR